MSNKNAETENIPGDIATSERLKDDNEQLHKSSERFRLKLIRDFRILENLTEEEANLEAPKYHAQACELDILTVVSSFTTELYVSCIINRTQLIQRIFEMKHEEQNYLPIIHTRWLSFIMLLNASKIQSIRI